jgi:hypothetical protein
MIWNIVHEEKRRANELLQSNIDFGVGFAELKPESAIRKAPLNRSTRPLPGTKIPEQYMYLIPEWALQDTLFWYLEELTEAAKIFGWDSKLIFEVRGLRGNELVYKLKAHRVLLRDILDLPWNREIIRKTRAFFRLNFPGKPAVPVRTEQGVIAGREVL